MQRVPGASSRLQHSTWMQVSDVLESGATALSVGTAAAYMQQANSTPPCAHEAVFVSLILADTATLLACRILVVCEGVSTDVGLQIDATYTVWDSRQALTSKASQYYPFLGILILQSRV